MLSSSSVALAFSICLAAASVAAEPRAEVLAHFTWAPDIKNFGGLSGLEVGPGGVNFTTVSDTAMLYQGAFERTQDGELIGANIVHVTPLLTENAERPKKKQKLDTEGLAISPDGITHISAESVPRLLTYETNQAVPKAQPLPRLSAQTPSNMGFEALALSPSGQLIAISESSHNLRDPYDIYQKHDTSDWKVIYQLPRGGGFRPVGADFGPDGHLYVLTRAFSGLGFTARISRVTFENGDPIRHERLFSGAFRQFDNLEGLAVWQTTSGEIRLIAVSDDNLNDYQETVVVEFRLTK